MTGMWEKRGIRAWVRHSQEQWRVQTFLRGELVSTVAVRCSLKGGLIEKLKPLTGSQKSDHGAIMHL